ncbi:MAG: HIT family protein [Lachnospiraceae bacterium]|jgi:histidine triad (HIT) family protein|nr:HIT family protein [Lachnospiraceae bacterium]
MKDDCIFCKLANGVYPTNSIYEDENFNVILDAGPATKGHALILPKEHYANLFELPDETASKVMVLAKKMATHMKEKLNCDGFNLVQNNGPCAGQTVFHFHYHLIPRYENDGQNILWEPKTVKEEDQKELCKLLSLKN